MSVTLEVDSPYYLFNFCREMFKTHSLADLYLVVCARQWHEYTRRHHRDDRDDNRGYISSGNGCGNWGEGSSR